MELLLCDGGGETAGEKNTTELRVVCIKIVVNMGGFNDVA